MKAYERELDDWSVMPPARLTFDEQLRLLMYHLQDYYEDSNEFEDDRKKTNGIKRLVQPIEREDRSD